MPDEAKTYSAELKTEVARKAIEQEKKNLRSLAEKYDVPVSSILTWAVELEKHGKEAFEDSDVIVETEAVSGHEEIEVEVLDREIASSISHGVMFDKLNIRRLIFWSVIGIVLVLIFVQGLMEMHRYNQQMYQETAGASTDYYPVNQLKREATETLNSFGVVDLENGIYRIPIDSAINEMAEGQ